MQPVRQTPVKDHALGVPGGKSVTKVSVTGRKEVNAHFGGRIYGFWKPLQIQESPKSIGNNELDVFREGV